MATTVIDLQVNNHRLTRLATITGASSSTALTVVDRSGLGAIRPNGLVPNHVSIQRIWYSTTGVPAVGTTLGVKLTGLADNGSTNLDLLYFNDSGFMDFSNAGGLVYARTPADAAAGDLSAKGLGAVLQPISVLIELIFHD